MPVLSIIVPVYKVEKYIHKCVDSILSQSFTDFELILVDDGSPDGCGQICDEYAARDKRVKVIHKDNGGVSDARNAGLDVAEGAWIAFVDSDDWIEKDYLQRYVNNIADGVEMVLSGFLQDDGHGKVVAAFRHGEEEVWQRERAIKEILDWKYVGWGPVSCIYKKTTIGGVRFSKCITFGEDLLFKYEVLKNCSAAKYIPYDGYHYMYNPASACNSYGVLKRMQDIPILEAILEEQPEYVTRRFFFKQYISRLIDYYRELRREDALDEDGSLKRELLAKLIKYRNKVLLSMDARFKMKLRLLKCLFYAKR